MSKKDRNEEEKDVRLRKKIEDREVLINALKKIKEYVKVD